MTPQDFAYWLKGFLELSNTTKLSEAQVAMISEHLDLVFDKRTSDREVLEENIKIKKELEELRNELAPEKMKGGIYLPPYEPIPLPNHRDPLMC